MTVEKYCKMILGFNDDEARKVAAEKVPGARSGEKVEIAKLSVLLFSEDARNFIGQRISADGGTTSPMSFISCFGDESILICIS